MSSLVTVSIEFLFKWLTRYQRAAPSFSWSPLVRWNKFLGVVGSASSQEGKMIEREDHCSWFVFKAFTIHWTEMYTNVCKLTFYRNLQISYKCILHCDQATHMHIHTWLKKVSQNNTYLYHRSYTLICSILFYSFSLMDKITSCDPLNGIHDLQP